MNADKNHGIDNQKNGESLTKNQAILYSIILGGAFTIFILSMIGINPFILLIIIAIVLVYVYFDKEIQETDSNNNNQIS